jgi:predicted nucleotidyltransferase
MPDIFNDDFRDFIQALNNNNVRYIVVGGFAVIFHGHARVTGDMDVWVEPVEKNYEQLVKAFHEFHMPVFDMTKENFLSSDTIDVFVFGRKPVAIDVMTKVKGLSFKACYKRSKIFESEGLAIRILHLNDLLTAKREAGRRKDIDDIEQLTNQ